MSIESSSIKFAYAENGETTREGGKSALSQACLIGAMALSAKKLTQDNQVIYQYATDQEGIEDLKHVIDDFIFNINHSITALSTAMAFVDNDELIEELQPISWLLCGLSELVGIAYQERKQLRKSDPLIKSEAK